MNREPPAWVKGPAECQRALWKRIAVPRERRSAPHRETGRDAANHLEVARALLCGLQGTTQRFPCPGDVISFKIVADLELEEWNRWTHSTVSG